MTDSCAEVLRDNECELCEREMPLTKHHVYPKDEHKRLFKKKLRTREELATTINICRQCHSAIHRLFSNKDLAAKFNTVEALCANEAVLQYIHYIRKQRTYTKAEVRNRNFRYRR